jgi:PAS domain S-box-containing protein
MKKMLLRLVSSILTDRLKLRFLYWLAFLILPLLFISAASPSRASSPERRILVINSYHHGFAWSESILQGIESGLAGERIQFMVEYMDTKRHQGAEYIKRFYTLLEYKYQRQQIDLIVAADDEAFQFLRRHHHKMFSEDTPVVFCGVNIYHEIMMIGYPMFTGILEDLELKPTMDMAFRLFPYTRTMYVITDNTTSGRNTRLAFQTIAEQYPDKRFLFPDPDKIANADTLVETMSKIPANSVVYYAGFFRDAMNRYVDYKDLVSRLSKACPAPVFVGNDYYVGLGVLGGYVVSGQRQGAIAANIASQIFNNTPVTDIPVIQESPNQFLFDYQQLKRFGVGPSRLPQVGVIINEPVSFYREHRKWFWTLAAFVIFQTFIIGAFALNLIRRRRAERQLLQREADYLRLVDNVAEGLLITQGDRLIFANHQAAAITGYAVSELLSRPFTEFVHPEDAVVMWENYQRRIKGLDAPEVRTSRVFYRDGSFRWVEFKTMLIEWEGRPAALSFCTDVTERKLAEDALKASEEKFARAFKESPVWVVISSLEDGRYIEVNDTFLRDTGFTRDEVIGRTSVELSTWPDQNDRKWIVDRIKEKGSVRNVEVERRTKSGDFLIMLFSGESFEMGDEDCLLSVSLDITENRRMENDKIRLENQLRDAQKMEALGTMAGGLAHDFNNILMGVLGRVSLMQAEPEIGQTQKDHLTSIEELVESATNLTRQLLAFARGGRFEPQVLDVNQLIQKTTKIFGRTHKQITVHENFDPQAWTVEVDRGQMEQVLLNLMINAWQAMPEGGDLHLVTENLDFRKGRRPHSGLSAQKYVRITVTDTGTGMDDVILQRIFDPFFTTREMGRGTGLGLASAYGIIKNHGGAITVKSQPGRGTSFHIFLPACGREITAVEKNSDRLIQGSEAILVVDDEPLVLEVAVEMLEMLGYRVVPAGGGQAALELFQELHDELDLVILDMIMPGMSGEQTYELLKKIDPNVKVMLSSGYSMSGQAERIIDKGCRDFLQKPFNLSELSRKVRTALDDSDN